MSCPPPNPPPVVIDNGSWSLKCGVAGDKAPKLDLPSNNAIKEGNVVDWDALTELWRGVFTKLNTTPDHQPILLTEPIMVAKSTREKMAEVMFEGFNASSIYLAKQPILSLYAAGRMDGIVAQLGHGVSQFVASSQGFAVPSASLQTTLAGETLSTFMSKLLADDGITGLEMDTVRDIKEKHGYVSLNFEQDERQLESVKVPYKLPDGKEVSIGKPRFACPEALFKPQLIDSNLSSIQVSLQDSITKAVASVSTLTPDTLYKNILVTGGSSTFPGTAERLKKELQALAPSGTEIDVTSTPGVGSCFIGGSILTCLPTMNPLWVTKQMYLESGAAVVHEKCV